MTRPLPTFHELTRYRAFLFDLDGVLTPTAEVHERAWADMFTAFFNAYTVHTGTAIAPYTDADYFTHLDGRRRNDGIQSLLASRGITLPYDRRDPAWQSIMAGSDGSQSGESRTSSGDDTQPGGTSTSGSDGSHRDEPFTSGGDGSLASPSAAGTVSDPLEDSPFDNTIVGLGLRKNAQFLEALAQGMQPYPGSKAFLDAAVAYNRSLESAAVAQSGAGQSGAAQSGVAPGQTGAGQSGAGESAERCTPAETFDRDAAVDTADTTTAADGFSASDAHPVMLAVVSSSKNAPVVLQAAHLDGYMQDVVDGLVAERHHLGGKPSPDTYVYAAEKAGLTPSEAVVFEDATSGVAAGRAGGFGLVVGINRGAGERALLDAGADIVVNDLADLLP